MVCTRLDIPDCMCTLAFTRGRVYTIDEYTMNTCMHACVSGDVSASVYTSTTKNGHTAVGLQLSSKCAIECVPAAKQAEHSCVQQVHHDDF
jgi:hypothetical protein